MTPDCVICAGPCTSLGSVDANKACEAGAFPPSGVGIQYVLCGRCGFSFAPEFLDWTDEQFARLIYNDDYVKADPDYREARPMANAESLWRMIGDAGIRHLDYGGGGGVLARLMRERGWDSVSYDPYADSATVSGPFDLITAYEVFEHAPHPRTLMGRLARLAAPNGMVMFSTLLSDGHALPDWWYAAPRNGHVSLYAKTSLAALAAYDGWTFGSFSDNFHSFWKVLPDWARRIIQVA